MSTDKNCSICWKKTQLNEEDLCPKCVAYYELRAQYNAKEEELRKLGDRLNAINPRLVHEWDGCCK